MIGSHHSLFHILGYNHNIISTFVFLEEHPIGIVVKVIMVSELVKDWVSFLCLANFGSIPNRLILWSTLDCTNLSC